MSFGGALHVHYDLETQRVLSVALEMTRVSLGLADDFANGIIAKRIIELAEVGERDPELLCEGRRLYALAHGHWRGGAWEAATSWSIGQLIRFAESLPAHVVESLSLEEERRTSTPA